MKRIKRDILNILLIEGRKDKDLILLENSNYFYKVFSTRQKA